MEPKLLERPLAEVARDASVAKLWEPLAAMHEAFVRRVRESAKTMGRVVLVDLADAPLDLSVKFVTYALYPECMYSVTLTRGKQHFKLSVGYNPWCGRPRAHDIASICRRYDGGGHPVVGAATFPLAHLDKAREATRTIALELNA